MTTITAQLRYLRIAPRKVRLVANALKGMDIARARAYLSAVPKRAADPILKTLESAVHNAGHNLGINESALKVKGVECGKGPTLKRFRPRAFGRAYPIQKRTSHVIVTLVSSEMPTRTHQTPKIAGATQTPKVITPAKLSEMRRVARDTQEGKAGKKAGPEQATKARPWQSWTRRLFQRKAV